MPCTRAQFQEGLTQEIPEMTKIPKKSKRNSKYLTIQVPRKYHKSQGNSRNPKKSPEIPKIFIPFATLRDDYVPRKS